MDSAIKLLQRILGLLETRGEENKLYLGVETDGSCVLFSIAEVEGRLDFTVEIRWLENLHMCQVKEALHLARMLDEGLHLMREFKRDFDWNVSFSWGGSSKMVEQAEIALRLREIFDSYTS